MSQKSLIILLWVLVGIAAAMLIAWIITISAKPDPAEQPPKKHPLEGCVTYQDLLEVEHPHKVDDYYLGGCCGCPHERGYESYDARLCADELIRPGEWGSFCKKCWNRHVPKETLTRLMEGQ